MINRTEGNHSLGEYIELELTDNKQYKVIAQSNIHDEWYVYLAERGKNGKVVTLTHVQNRDIGSVCAYACIKLLQILKEK